MRARKGGGVIGGRGGKKDRFVPLPRKKKRNKNLVPLLQAAGTLTPGGERGKSPFQLPRKELLAWSAEKTSTIAGLLARKERRGRRGSLRE